MGYMRHHAILVTTWKEEYAAAAHEVAERHCKSVSPVQESAINGYLSFAVFPDGSKEGWDESEEGDKGRAGLIAWLDSQRHSDGSSPFDWVEVQYGDDKRDTLVCAHSDEKHRHEVRR